MSDFSNIPEFTRDYEIGERLGEGGFGVVVKAYHKRLRKTVVIKESKLVVSEDKARAEVDILKDLHHPNLPQVYDFFIDNGRAFTIMDFIEGQSVGDMLKRNYRFSKKDVYKYARQLLMALDYLHSRPVPIIHGDIKPDNIMITPEGNVCLIDFNISGLSGGEKAYTNGYTPGYSAPEQEAEFKKIVEQMKAMNAAAAAVPVQARTPSYSSESTALLNSGTEESTALLDSGAGEATELLDAGMQEATELLTPGNRAPRGKNEAAYSAAGQMQRPAPASAPAVRMEIPIDKRSDVYSAGATIFRMYTGTVFDRNKPAVLKSNTSEAFIYVLNKSLQADPKKRFQSGGEMLRAIEQIYKKDSKYRGLIARTAVFRIILVVGIIAGIMLVFEGGKKKEEERSLAYDQLIEEMAYRLTDEDLFVLATTGSEITDSRLSEKTTEFDGIFKEAVALLPQRDDAYYQKAMWLYKCGKYVDGISFIIDSFEDSAVGFDSATTADMYYILGNCYYQLGYYEDAASAFEVSIDNNGTNPNIYVDYAITLSELGKDSESETVLQRAGELGIQDDLLLLTQGDIGLKRLQNTAYSITASGADVAEAAERVLKAYDSCINTSSDDYIRFRACIGAGQAYELYIQAISDSSQKADLSEKRIALFDKMSGVLPQKYRLQIYENLVRYCDSAFVITGDSKYNDASITALNKIIDMGYATRTTFENLCNAYRRQKDYDKALEVLGKLESSYSGNYRVYMLYAYTYAEIEATKDNDSRNYADFYRCYEKAVELYSSHSEQDIEMQSLQGIYQEVVDNGW